MGPGDLQDVLGGLRQEEHADLLVGLGKSDDAAVYRVSDDVAIVETVDFFPPIVDDPATFGAIAATNALNDVFAMGGRPLLALSIASFPESPTVPDTYAYTADQIASLVRVLYGEVNPTGKLPVSIPRSDGSGELFPFGHGLGY